jgi:hypothetical protein
MAIGMGCVFVAGSLTERLAAKTRFHPHSRVGYTFLWRLQFLDNLTAAQRTALIQKVAKRARSDETRRLLSLLSQIHDEGAFSPGSFPPRAAALLYPTDQIVPWEKVDLALNKMAFAFLVPPGTELRQAAATDFATTAKMPVTAITDHLFEMTAYYFEHRDDMPACAGLVTFRNYNAESITRFPRDFAYFHLWRGLDYRRAVMVWFAALLLLLVVGRWKKANIARVIGFGVALAIIGTLMFAITCLLGEWLPRYALPLWQLLLLSLFLFAGKTGDLVWSRRAVGDVSTRG